MDHLPSRIFRCRKKDDVTQEVSLELGVLKDAIRSGQFAQTDHIWDDDVGDWLPLKSHPATAPLFSQTLWDAWDESSSFTMISDLRARRGAASTATSDDEEMERDAASTATSDDEEMERDADAISIADQVQSANDGIMDLELIDLEPIDTKDSLDDVIYLSDSDLEPLPNPTASIPKSQSTLIKSRIPPKKPPLVKKEILPIEAAIFGLPNPEQQRKSKRLHSPASYGWESNQKLDKRAAEALGDMLLPPRRGPKKAKASFFYGFNWVRLVLIVAPLALIGWAYLSVIELEVSQTYRQKQQKETSKEPLSDMQQKEVALREKLQQEKIQLINLDNSFERALLIGLSNMNINVLDIKAPIKGWVGRRLDEPSRASIDIRIKSKGESATELAAIALVVGKYITAKSLDIESFTVRFDEGGIAYSQTIKPSLAEKFYLERINMIEFLEKQLDHVANE